MALAVSWVGGSTTLTVGGKPVAWTTSGVRLPMVVPGSCGVLSAAVGSPRRSSRSRFQSPVRTSTI